MSIRGFIFQASYRVVTTPTGGRGPAVYLYGQLENGGTFLVRDDRQRPHFYIRAAHAERARALGASLQTIDRQTFDGATQGMLDKAGAIWKGTKKSEITGIERLRKFVCEKDGVKEAFSGKCPKCGKDLIYKDEDKSVSPDKKKKRDYKIAPEK